MELRAGGSPRAPGEGLARHHRRVRAPRCAADVRRCREVHLWSVPPISPEPRILASSGGRTSHLAFSPDGTFAAAIREGRVEVWSVPDGGERELELDRTGLMSVAVAPRGRRVYASDPQHRIHVWDGESGAALESALAGPAPSLSLPADALAISPDGTVLVHGHDDGTIVLWDLPSGQRLGPALQGHGPRAWVLHATFSADGRVLATSSLGRAGVSPCQPSAHALGAGSLPR